MSVWRNDMNCRYIFMFPLKNLARKGLNRPCRLVNAHYSGVIIGAMASQITSLAIFYSTVYSGGDQRKHQSSASLAFVWGIHRWPVNSPHKWPVTRKMFPFDDVIGFLSSLSAGGKLTGPWLMMLKLFIFTIFNHLSVIDILNIPCNTTLQALPGDPLCESWYWLR